MGLPLRLLLAALAAVLIVPLAPAQEDAPSERERIKAALAVLRDRRASVADQDGAIDELLTLGAEGPRRLAAHAERQAASLTKGNGKDAAKVFKAFGRRAAVVVKTRLDRDGQAAVEAARATILKNARDKGLTKDRIKAESDPAFAQLEQLLVVTPAQVWEVDENLFEDWSELLDAMDEEARWRAAWERARAALEAHPEGARQAARMDPPESGDWTSASILDELDRRAWRATPMGEASQKILDRNLSLAEEIDAAEFAGIQAHNRRRILIGLGAQAIDVKLCAAGRDHSKDMAEEGFFSHTSPVPGKRTFGERASRAGTSANAENIAMGAREGPSVVMQWWYSPGHHRNMLGGQGRIGLGRHGTHWTELFG